MSVTRNCFFYFAGHGTNVKDRGKDEADGFDKCIITHSMGITDDVIFEIMVRKLPEDVRFTAVFDCCMSGSILDLPYTEQGGKLKKNR